MFGREACRDLTPMTGIVSGVNDSLSITYQNEQEN
jgi:hypothetical protein